VEDLITIILLVISVSLDCLVDSFLDFCLREVFFAKRFIDSDEVVKEVSQNFLACDGQSRVLFIHVEKLGMIFVMSRVVENRSQVRVHRVCLRVNLHFELLSFKVTKGLSFTQDFELGDFGAIVNNFLFEYSSGLIWVDSELVLLPIVVVNRDGKFGGEHLRHEDRVR